MDGELDETEKSETLLDMLGPRPDTSSAAGTGYVGESKIQLTNVQVQDSDPDVDENISVTESVVSAADASVASSDAPLWESTPAYRPRKAGRTDFFDDDDDEKPPLSSELEQGYKILRGIMSDTNKSINWPFKDPVDTEGLGLYDYHERIKQPMWLKKSKYKQVGILYNTV